MSFHDIVQRLKQNSSGIVGPLLNKWLLERNQVATEVEPWIHPSSMPTSDKMCARAMFFDVNTPIDIYPVELLTKDHSAKTHRVFDTGTAMHRRWQAYFIELGICDPRVNVGWEIPVLDESLILKGHADAIIYPDAYKKNKVRIQTAGLARGQMPITNDLGGFCYDVWDEESKSWVDWKIDMLCAANEDGGYLNRERWWKPYGEPILVDFKSINSYQYNLLAAPLPHHHVQITSYLGWLRENCIPELSRSILLYENKDTQEFKEFPLALDTKLWALLKTNLREVVKSKRKGALPKPICKSAIEPRAGECPWQHLCFNVESYKDLLSYGKTKKNR